MRFRFCGDLDCPDWVLSEVATVSQMSSVRLRLLVQQIVRYCIQGTFDYDKVVKLAADNADGIPDIKGSVAAIHYIITNSARHNLDEATLLMEIQQLGLPKENADAIAKQFRDSKDALRDKFAEDSYRISKLVGADWRVDRVLATSAQDEPSCVVQMRLQVDTKPHLREAEEKLRTVAFEMSPEKLSVLIHELSAAHSAMEGLQG